MCSMWRNWMFGISAVMLLGFWNTALAEPYALRMFKLGTTLSEFRAIPYPDHPGSDYPGARLYCTGDAVISQFGANKTYIFYELRLSDSETKSGVKRCKYYYGNESTRARGSRSVGEAPIMVGNLLLSPTFDFLSNRENPEIYRLHRVQIIAHTGEFGQFLSAYKEKFGEPHSASNESTQNRLGAIFENHVITWANDESSILMEQRWGSIDTMLIVYSHHLLQQELNKRREAIEGKPSDRL